MTPETPTAKEALIEAAKRYGKIDPAGHFHQEERIALRLAVFGMIELLMKDDPMIDVLKSYQTFEVASFPVMLSEDKCDTMETAIEDFRAAAEARAEHMEAELSAIREQLGVAE